MRSLRKTMWLRAQRAHSETCGRSHRVRGLRSAVLRVRLADTCRSSRTTETCADQPSRRAGALPPPARASPAALPASALAPRGEGGSATRQAAPFLRAATRLAHTRNGGRRGAPAPRSLAPPACATRRRTAARSARRHRSRASLSRVATHRVATPDMRSLPQIGRSRSQPPAPSAAGAVRDQQGPRRDRVRHRRGCARARARGSARRARRARVERRATSLLVPHRARLVVGMCRTRIGSVSCYRLLFSLTRYRAGLCARARAPN